ncbi:MAG: [FeFe] hydrogenase H-cluster radical SAM maturase HydE [Calditrichaceae bacterium]
MLTILNEDPHKRIELNRSQIIDLLKTDDPYIIKELYNRANKIRARYCGEEIHVRGLINFSNYCKRACLYCGLRKNNKNIQRYRLTTDQIFATVSKGVTAGYKTFVLQSGEDPYYTDEMVSGLIRMIKSKFSVALTLSLGERPYSTLKKWREDGADRYLLKHETSDAGLYRRLHPDLEFHNRITSLINLKEIGYQTGSGIMIGLPGQTYESIADDIILFRNLDIDMIGCGPYIYNPDTPKIKTTPNRKKYIQPEAEFIYKITAINRIMIKDALIPATTALTTIEETTGQKNALLCGANVIMLDITPLEVKHLYKIYPKKDFIDGIKDAEILFQNLTISTGRPVSKTLGHRAHL